MVKILSFFSIDKGIQEAIAEEKNRDDMSLTRPALVAQGVSTRRTGHILEALLPQGELREREREQNSNVHRHKALLPSAKIADILGYAVRI